MKTEAHRLYALTLLFQYRVVECPSTMRLCEKRIIHIKATSFKDAIRKAESAGRKDRLKYKNDRGDSVLFEFVAVIDAIDMNHVQAGDNEVWYDIVKMKLPMEQKDNLRVQLGSDGVPKSRIHPKRKARVG